MTKETFIKLAEKYAEGDCSEKERQLVEKFYQEMQKKNPRLSWSPEEIKTREVKLLNNIKDKIGRNQVKSKFSPNWSFIGKAAAVIALFGFILFTLLELGLPKESTTSTEWVTRENSSGKISKILLPDSSQVWLSVSSKLSYPKTFDRSIRNVTLSGQAYFDVTHNEKKPFIVSAKDIQVTVLGTRFDVSSYPNDLTVISLESGSVKLESGDKSQNADIRKITKILAPGEQAFLNKSKSDFEIHEFDIHQFAQWREGIIKFEETPLPKVISTLERWYGVKFEYQERQFKNCTITAEYQKESLQNVMESLRYFLEIDYEFRENTVLLTGSGC